MCIRMYVYVEVENKQAIKTNALHTYTCPRISMATKAMSVSCCVYTVHQCILPSLHGVLLGCVFNLKDFKQTPLGHAGNHTVATNQ